MDSEMRVTSAAMIDSASELSPEALASVAALYERGLYMQAYREATQIKPLDQWRGVEARILAGRLAGNLGGGRLAHLHFVRAWRESPDHHEAIHYFGRSLVALRGPLEAWEFIKKTGDLASASAPVQAYWWAHQAHVLGLFRDSQRAHAALAKAEHLAPADPWVLVERSYLLVLEDRYEQAREACEQALKIHPWYRPAVQALAECMVLCGCDEPALSLLTNAREHLESYAVAMQQAHLQMELGLCQEARAALNECAALAPLIDRDTAQSLTCMRSEAAYLCGEMKEALHFAQQAGKKSKYFEHMAEKFQQPHPHGQRKILPVGFIRQHHVTCAPATMSAIARYWSRPVQHLELAEQICYDGTPNHSERQWAEQHGWHTREFTVTLDAAKQLIDLGIPFTLTTVDPASSHLQAVVGYDSIKGTLIIRDPYLRSLGEAIDSKMLEHYQAHGPRGHAFVPADKSVDLLKANLPDAHLYDIYHELQLALTKHDRDAALRASEQLTAAEPSHRLKHFATLSIAKYDGNSARSLEALNQLLQQFPDNPVLTLLRLRCLSDLGRRDERLEIYRNLCSKADCHPVFWQQYAQELGTDASESEVAVRLARRCIRRMVDLGGSLYVLSNLMWFQRQFERSAEFARLAACANDKNEQFAKHFFSVARFVGRDDEALALLQARVSTLGSRSTQPAITLFQAYEDIEQLASAYEVLEHALAQKPQDGALLLFAADSYGRYGNLSRAGDLLQAAQGAAQNTAWLRTAAMISMYQGERQAAIGKWRDILDIEPLAIDAHRVLARLLAESQGIQQAIEHLQQAVAAFPHSHALQELLVEWLRRDYPEQAENALRGLLTYEPANGWAWCELARVLIRLRKTSGAIDAVENAQRLDPENPAVISTLGGLRASAGDRPAAIEAYRRAIELNPDLEPAQVGYLQECSSRAERQQALEMIWESLRRHQFFGDGILVFAQLASQTLDSAELLTRFEQAHGERPDRWQIWTVLIRQLMQMNELVRARQIAAEATERFPFIPASYLDLARVAGVQNDERAQIEGLQRALQINPSFSPASLELAEVFSRAGNLDQAHAVLERAAHFSPLDSSIHAELAEIRWKLGNRDGAFQSAARAADLDPSNQAVWDRLLSWTTGTPLRNWPMEMAQTLTQRRGGDANSWLVLARLQGENTEIQSRLDAVERAIELEPRNASAHQMKSQILAQAGRFEEAIAECQSDIWCGEPPLELQAQLAHLEAMRADLPAAVRQMQRVVEQEPNYYIGWMKLAEWKDQMGDFAGSQAAAQQLIRLAPHHPASMAYLADAHLKNGDRKTAKQYFEQAFNAAPDYYFAGISFFNLCLEDADRAGAERALQTLRLHIPEITIAIPTIRLALHCNAFPAAVESFERVCKSAEALTESTLGEAVREFEKAGRLREIESVLRKCVAQEGTHPSAGYWWVRIAATQGPFGPISRRFKSLARRGEMGNSALIACLEILSENTQISGVGFFMWRWRRLIASDNRIWAIAMSVWRRRRKLKKACRLAMQWRQRSVQEPWMLLQAFTTLYASGHDKEANACLRAALQMPRDEGSIWLELWAAADGALAGDVSTADAYLPRFDRQKLEPYPATIYDMIQAVLTMRRSSAQEPDCFAKSQKLMASAVLHDRLWKMNPEIVRLYRRSIAAIAKERRGLRAYIWRRWRSFNANQWVR